MPAARRFLIPALVAPRLCPPRWRSARLRTPAAPAAPGTKTITFADLMKFRAIGAPVISEDGTVVAYGLQPDRGDGEGVVHALATGRTIRVPLGGSPVISKNGRFVAMVVKVPFARQREDRQGQAEAGHGDRGRRRRATVTNVENVERFAFSDDSRWLAYQLPAPEAAEKPAAGRRRPAAAARRAARRSGRQRREGGRRR